MSKTFFDIHSRDTFNNIDYIFFTGERNKEHSFPPWLRLPTYYTKELWKRVINNQYGMLYLNVLGNGVILDLECGHDARISEITIKMNPRVREIYVNCSKCGGTGEVRIV